MFQSLESTRRMLALCEEVSLPLSSFVPPYLRIPYLPRSSRSSSWSQCCCNMSQTASSCHRVAALPWFPLAPSIPLPPVGSEIQPSRNPRLSRKLYRIVIESQNRCAGAHRLLLGVPLGWTCLVEQTEKRKRIARKEKRSRARERWAKYYLDR